MSSAPPPAPPGPPPSTPPPGWNPGPSPAGRRTPWGWILAAVGLVVLLVVGAVVAVVLVNGDDDPTAGDSRSTTSASSATTSSATTSSAAAPVDASALDGHWSGTYTCAQGDTGLSLDVIATSDTQLTAIFHFRKIPQNPDVPEGSYKMTGTLEDGRLRLRRLAWIDRPPGYVMVGLNARVTDPQAQQLTGTVSNVGCQEFTITRQ